MLNTECPLSATEMCLFTFGSFVRRKLKLSDAGDIPGGLTLEEGHSRLRAKVGSLLASGAIPFVVGGGNDQSFPNGSALLDQAKGC